LYVLCGVGLVGYGLGLVGLAIGCALLSGWVVTFAALFYGGGGWGWWLVLVCLDPLARGCMIE
jgi:hypothetical protein